MNLRTRQVLASAGLGLAFLTGIACGGGGAASQAGKTTEAAPPSMATIPLGELTGTQTVTSISLRRAYIYGPDLAERSARYESVMVDYQKARLAEQRDLERILNAYGFNTAAVISRMAQTKALDGTQTADGRYATMHWNYHPDDAFSITLEMKP